jgi:hypothetical protein
MSVTVIASTKWARDGEKVVLTEFDCFPSIEAQGPITWTPADKTIEFTRSKPWSVGDYTIVCEGDATEKGGTQCYITETGARKCSDKGRIFSMQGGDVSMIQLILVQPPEEKKSKLTLSNMKRSRVSTETGTTGK